jgi:hypothetical protein
VSALTPDQVAPLLAATVATLRAEVRGLGLEARWRPASGEWSVNECVGHLLESEARGFAGRVRAIMKVDGVVLVSWDPVVVDGFAQTRPVILFDNQGVSRSSGTTPDNVVRCFSTPATPFVIRGLSCCWPLRWRRRLWMMVCRSDCAHGRRSRSSSPPAGESNSERICSHCSRVFR